MKNFTSITFLVFLIISTFHPAMGQDCIRPTFTNNTARNALQIGIVRDCESFLGDETPHVNRRVILDTQVEFIGLLSSPQDCEEGNFILYRMLIEDALPLNEDFPPNDFIDITEGTSVTVPLLPGDYEVSIFAISDLDAPVSLQSNSVNFTLEVKASDNPYQQPDEIWDIELAEEFVPLCGNSYSNDPEDPLFQYGQPSSGCARAYVQYGNYPSGEQHTSLVQPMILVEGVDFPTETVSDPATGEIVRIGSNGWENVIQGLVPGATAEGEPELFRNYPEFLASVRSSSQASANENYDIILIDFCDGADYIDKNARVLIELIKRVNDEKECGAENVILGLSMGGQVARLALSMMESEGADHECKQYISLDSPHLNASIPLAIQSFAWANANFPDNPCGASADQASTFWNFLNKPAARQMLENTFLNEISQGNLSGYFVERPLELSLSNGPGNMIDFGVDNQTFWSDYVDLSLDHSCLFTSYQDLKDQLGYPTLTENIAIANGSGNATISEPLANQFCLMNAEITPSISALITAGIFGGLNGPTGLALNAELNSFLSKENSDIKMILNTLPGRPSEISYGPQWSNIVFEMQLLRAGRTDFAVVKIGATLGDELNYEIAPGCVRNDMEVSILPAIADQGEVWYLNSSFNCSSSGSTFMPTFSVIGFETSDISVVMNDILPEETPFEEFYAPNINEAHVDLNADNQEWLLPMLNGGTGENTITSYTIPSQSLGSYRNIGSREKRVVTHVINNDGTLFIHNEGPSGFENNLQQDYGRPYYKGSLGFQSCGDSPHFIEVNQGGLLQLGSSTVQRSGHLTALNGTSINIHGGDLMMYKESSITLLQGSNFLLDQGSEINIADNSQIEINGNFITTGDVTINCEGTIIIGETAEFSLGGKLTINGLEINDDLLLINGNHNIVASIEINNGTISFVEDASLSIEPSFYDNDINASFNDIKLRQNGNTSSFIDLLSIGNIGQVSIDNMISQNLNTRNILSLLNIDQVQLSRISMHNCYKSLIADNISTLNITDSRFRSTPVSANGQSVEYFHGVLLSDINNVNIDNSSFNGFGDFYDSENTLYSLKLIDCPVVNIADSEFTENRTGIYVPFDPELQQYGVQSNNTNLFLDNTLFQDNYTGIEMYGYSTEFVNVNSSGFLYMECVRMLDNFYGVQGENIRVQADHYFSNEQSSINIFRPIPKGSPGGGGGGSVSFYVTYTNQSYSHIYLLGNAWYDFDSNELFLNADGSWAQVVKQPGIDAQSPDQFFGCIETVVIDYPCVGCFQQEDDDDCNFMQNNENTNLAAIYREAIAAVRDRDFGLASERFTPLATIESSLSSSALPSKCAYQADISRVFARPVADDAVIGKREASRKTFSIVPNPSSAFISLKGGTDTHIEIYSSTGEKLVDKDYRTGDRIDVSELSPGLYFLQDTHSQEASRFIVIR